jgi:hypothetical protein
MFYREQSDENKLRGSFQQQTQDSFTKEND